MVIFFASDMFAEFSFDPPSRVTIYQIFGGSHLNRSSDFAALSGQRWNDLSEGVARPLAAEAAHVECRCIRAFGPAEPLTHNAFLMDLHNRASWPLRFTG